MVILFSVTFDGQRDGLDEAIDPSTFFLSQQGSRPFTVLSDGCVCVGNFLSLAGIACRPAKSGRSNK